MQQSKRYPGAIPGGQLAFAVEARECATERNITGFVKQVWCTGEMLPILSGGEQYAFTGLNIIGMTLGMPTQMTSLYVVGSPRTVGEMLEGLHRMPDYGTDFMGVAPLARCVLDRPEPGFDLDFHALKFVRLQVGGGAVR